MSHSPRQVTNPAPETHAAVLWSERLAEEVEARLGPEAAGRPIVCASGISPSGPIHMGNLREVLTTHLVAEALRARGHDVVHLHSWDDYDRLRKLPAGVDASYERSIGMPLAQIPDPWDTDGSYAEHHMREFTDALVLLGVVLHEVRQSERYPAGAYNAEIRRAIDARELVFDTLAAQQTSGRHDKPLEERRREYFPFKAYCERCGRDDTHVTAYAAETVTYRCRCGHEGSMSLADGARISGKLVWKVDWPMRWAHEGVRFEPAGEDHHAPTGSFTVGRTLVREVFEREPPHSAVYSFVTLAGVGGKMSGSTGAAAVPAAALRVLEPAIVRWLYIRRLPSQSFAIDLSAKGVQKLYDEWDRFVARAQQPDAAAADVAMYRLAVRSSSGAVASAERRVSFRLLAAAADLTQGNREQIGRIVAQHLDEPAPSIDRLLAELEPRLSCAVNYVELLPPEQRTTLRERFDAPTWEGLDDATRGGIAILARELDDAWSLDGLTELVYAVPKLMLALPRDAPPSPELKQAQRAFFKALYQLLCASDTGPRLPTLMLSIGPDRTRELLLGDAQTADEPVAVGG
ncbi:MAG: lysyl-tRNA synthetase, class [Solirubrobacteraceae bacterium]|nr:lysyl-tRNA synthetase, class [Solirubrobacteraceae bacterium]